MEKSFLQAQAEASSFHATTTQADAQRSVAERHLVPEPLPCFQQTRIDRCHPDADWAGRVLRGHGPRRAVADAPNGSLVAGAGGITVGQGGGRTAAAATSGGARRHFQPHETAQTSREGQGAPLSCAAYQVGPGGRHDCSGWQTSSQAFQQGSVTTKEMYDEGKGSNLSRRQHVVPAVEAARSGGSGDGGAAACLSVAHGSAVVLSAGARRSQVPYGQSYGHSRYAAPTKHKPSLLAGVTSNVLRGLPSGDQTRLAQRPVAMPR